MYIDAVRWWSATEQLVLYLGSLVLFLGNEVLEARAIFLNTGAALVELGHTALVEHNAN
jgi:hypothetical protein